MFEKYKPKLYPRCDKVREELNEVKKEVSNIELLVTQKFDKVVGLIEKTEAGREKTEERIGDFLDKVEGTLYGNGGVGMKTEMELIKQKEERMSERINGIGQKVSENAKQLIEKEKELSDKIIKIDKQVTINTTKIMVYAGGVGTIVGLISVFAPMLFNK